MIEVLFLLAPVFINILKKASEFSSSSPKLISYSPCHDRVGWFRVHGTAISQRTLGFAELVSPQIKRARRVVTCDSRSAKPNWQHADTRHLLAF
jgi:hypothetical protein